MSVTKHKQSRTLVLIITLFLISASLSLTLGIYTFSFSDLWSFITQDNASKAALVFWELRLPRLFIAVLGGGSLATAGFLMQSIVKNPLASPNLTGVMSGSALMVLSAIMFQLPLSSLFWGIAGGLAGGVLTLSVSWKNGVTPARLALAGISVSAFCQAMVTFILLSGHVDSEALFFWLTGSNAGASWQAFWPLLFTVVPMLFLLILSFRQRAYLELDDDVARGLGIAINWYRLMFGLIAVILTAASVGAFGPVGFIGLVAPHVSRMLGFGISGAAIIGALLVVCADFLSRTLMMPLEIPIGVLTALMGAPWFLYLIIKKIRAFS